MIEPESSGTENPQLGSQFESLLANIRTGEIIRQWAALPYRERLRLKVLVAALHLALQTLEDPSLRPISERDLPHFRRLNAFGDIVGDVEPPDPEWFSSDHPLNTVVRDLSSTLETFRLVADQANLPSRLNPLF